VVVAAVAAVAGISIGDTSASGSFAGLHVSGNRILNKSGQ
jgi:hypothetical protein